MATKTKKQKSTQASGSRISVNLTPREAYMFFQKLASDDDFRRRFEASPHESLAENHIYIPLEELPERVVLPPKEDLQKVLAGVTLGEDFVISGGGLQGFVFIVFLAFFAFMSIRRDLTPAQD